MHLNRSDTNGPYHFNIQINSQPIQHVYVIPRAIDDPIITYTDYSVELLSNVRWRWQFMKITG